MTSNPPPASPPPHRPLRSHTDAAGAPWQSPRSPDTISRSNWRFLGYFWRLLVGVKDALVLFLLLLFFLLLYALLHIGGAAPALAQNGALLLRINGTITEQPAQLSFTQAIQIDENTPREYRASDLIRALDTAARDNRVKTVVLDLDRFMGGGQVSVSDVGRALDRVRAAKKPVLVYATVYSDRGYQLASHASEIWMNPLGQTLITGPGGQNLYFKDALDRLGVKAHVYRVGTYKSAVEPFMRNDMSPEAREAAKGYSAVVWDSWLGEVKRARPKAMLDTFIANPLPAAGTATISDAAVKSGLVDRLGDKAAFGAHVANLVGVKDTARPWTFNYIPLESWLSANPAPTSGTPIAVVPVVGEIIDGSQPPGSAGGDTVAKYLLDAVADESVKAIVMRVDSPGGSVLASERIRQAVLAAKARGKPVVVSMANLAASGGYWISTPADRIIAEPDTITGSIGVFGLIPSFETGLGKWGVHADGIKTTPLSGEPNVVGGIDPRFDAMIQRSIEDIYGRFTGLVAEGRKLPVERVRQIAEGRVWAGGTAHQLGLVDGFGDLNVALNEAARLAKLDPGTVYPKYFEKAPDNWAELWRSMSGRKDSEDWMEQDSVGLLAHVRYQRDTALATLAHQAELISGSTDIQALCLECTAGVSTVPPRPGDNWWSRATALLVQLSR